MFDWRLSSHQPNTHYKSYLWSTLDGQQSTNTQLMQLVHMQVQKRIQPSTTLPLFSVSASKTGHVISLSITETEHIFTDDIRAFGDLNHVSYYTVCDRHIFGCGLLCCMCLLQYMILMILMCINHYK